MTYDEKLASRLREALSQLPDVKEKKMFGGLAFMVGNKMCLTAGPGRIMCRIDPELHEVAIKRKGCTTVVMGGRKYNGYVHVTADALRNKKALDSWVELALEFNKKTTSAKR